MTITVDIISWLATVCTIGLFLSSIPTCMNIIRRKSASNVNFFPFVAMFCNAAFWMKYGLLKNDQTLTLVNGIGVLLNTAYMIIFYIYTVYKVTVYKYLMGASALIFPVFFYVQYFAHEREVAIAHLGIVCCTFGAIAYGAPLSAMAHVIREKSTQTMAFPLSLANFVVSSEWTAYGFLVDDINIIIPNGLGVFLGLAQLLLFVIYPSSPTEDVKILR